MSKSTYLGERTIPVKQTPYAAYNTNQWALYLIGRYGGIDGAHHKTWVLDQVVRVLLGAPMIVKQATWTDHATEWCIDVGEPTEAYKAWELAQRRPNGGDEDEYEYDKGIAP